MITHTTTKRIRYGETDQMGYLYYGNYALYYEIGRVELLRSLGMSYRILEQECGVMMPVTAMQSRYVRPGKYDELVAITTTLRELPERQIVFHFELHNESGALLNGGRVSLCFVDMQTNARIACPGVLTKLLAPHFA